MRGEAQYSLAKRLGNGIALAVAPVDLTAVCREVLDEFRTAHAERTGSFHVDGDVTGEWSILRESHPHEEEGGRLQWTLTLGPQEEVSLRYRIRMNVK